MEFLQRSGSTIEIRDDVVLKTYESRDAFFNELRGYTYCHWAAPELVTVNVSKKQLVIERCTPLYRVPQDLDHARQAWDLLSRLHDSGWNHRDAALTNMVLHPERGVLLIDWEPSRPVPDPRNTLSYDLHGAVAAGFPQEEIFEAHRPEGIWWGNGRRLDPGEWWGFHPGLCKDVMDSDIARWENEGGSCPNP